MRLGLVLTLCVAPLVVSDAQAGWGFFKGKSVGVSAERKAIVKEALNHVGEPFVWDRSGPDAFDCSGFVHYVLKAVLKSRFTLPYSLDGIRGYRNQSVYYRDTLRAKKAQVKCSSANPGDVIFFAPSPGDNYFHIGLITNPKVMEFVTAQGRAFGVRVDPYGPATHWGRHSPECFNNIWVSN